MLTISNALSASQAVRYHEEEFANAQANYYSEGGQVLGRWHGTLADEWGLKGEVAKEHFERLANGQHPLTGEELVRHQVSRTYVDPRTNKQVRTMEHRGGWDATFSAPKGVSLTAGPGGDAGVRGDHSVAVKRAVAAMERFVQARMGGNRPAVTTGRWIAVAFEHDSARPVDGYAAPQLHTHVVFFNVTRLDDGEFRALQPLEIFRAQQYGTAVYRSELARLLRLRGYELEVGPNGVFDIAGYSQEYLEASSPRRQQIQEHLRTRGLRGAEAAQIAAQSTRAKKQLLPRDEVQRRHLELAVAHGNQPQRVVERAAGHVVQTLSEEQKAQVLEESVVFACARGTERSAVVSRRELLSDALRHSVGETSLAEVQAGLERAVLAGRLVEVAPVGADRAFTTPDMLDLERDTLRRMLAGRGACEELVSKDVRAGLEESLAQLSPSYRSAVERLLAMRDRMGGMDGVAGAGKTASVEIVRRGAELSGYETLGLAATARAAKKLKECGLETMTLQKLIGRSEGPRRGQPRLFVLDESSLAGTRQMNAFLERLGPRDRVLLVGDVRQHEAVEAGRPFLQLQQAGMLTVQLDEIKRQRDLGLKEAVELLSRGEVAAAVARLDAQGRVHEVADRQERLAAVAQAYLDRTEGTLIVSPDNRARCELNDLVHCERRRLGQVDAVEHRLDLLIERQEMVNEDRAWAGQYEVGDVVRYTKGSKELRIPAGSYARVETVDRASNLLTVVQMSGETRCYDPRRLQGVAVYRQTELVLGRGDRVQFTAASRELGVSNRDLGTIEEIEGRHMVVRLDPDRAGSPRTVRFDTKQHPHLDLGYAVTSYSGQGQTTERVLVHVDTRLGARLVNGRMAYVAVSRAQYDAQIFTDDKQSLPLQLGRDLSRSTALTLSDIGELVREHAASQPAKVAEAVAQAVDVPTLVAGVALRAAKVAVGKMVEMMQGQEP